MADHLLSSQNLDGGVHGGGHNACGLAQIASHLGALSVHQMLLDEVVTEADSAPDSAKELCLDPPIQKVLCRDGLPSVVDDVLVGDGAVAGPIWALGSPAKSPAVADDEVAAARTARGVLVTCE